MKKLFALSLIFALIVSCSLDDDNTEYHIEFVPIESVDIPDEFVLGETYPITVNYLKPSTCHTFRDFYYKKDLNQRTVAVINYHFSGNDCEDLTDEMVEETFNFIVTSNGSYIFNFWQGEDTDGEDQFLTVEVPVVE